MITDYGELCIFSVFPRSRYFFISKICHLEPILITPIFSRVKFDSSTVYKPVIKIVCEEVSMENEFLLSWFIRGLIRLDRSWAIRGFSI